MRRRATCFCFVPPRFPSFRTGCFAVFAFSFFICHRGRKASWYSHTGVSFLYKCTVAQSLF
ncbi:uncharacterized protein N7487_001495 [Penicillium crustosum]|uniref:uncharacterized protein n=1 Tax=Penicillium crustosum TaxID=36656 RepID=UPI0023A788DD|nr:uncharacterized protein N7487_001495 [Penicillium crustosum]KAJ5417945.1 hypothetical protein N7487_001495 [Penicillium crustosum]